jgi:hypothetical protein
MLKIPAEYESNISSTKLTAISRQVSPYVATRYLCLLLPDIYGGKSEMIRTQMRAHNRSEMVAVLETPYAIPSHNSNKYIRIARHKITWESGK